MITVRRVSCGFEGVQPVGRLLRISSTVVEGDADADPDVEDVSMVESCDSSSTEGGGREVLEVIHSCAMCEKRTMGY